MPRAKSAETKGALPEEITQENMKYLALGMQLGGQSMVADSGSKTGEIVWSDVISRFASLLEPLQNLSEPQRELSHSGAGKLEAINATLRRLDLSTARRDDFAGQREGYTQQQMPGAMS